MKKSVFPLTAMIIAVSLLLQIPIFAEAEVLERAHYDLYKDLFRSAHYTDDAGTEIPYRLYVPEDYSERACPVILTLHGAGERGVNNEYQIMGGITSYLMGDKALANEAIIIAPQCPENGQWVDVDWAVGIFSINEVPESPYLACAVSLMLEIARTYGADMNRLYATGYSMGGYGTWDIAARHPGLLAAALPICGGGDPTLAERYIDLPIRTYHCTGDGVVPFKGTQALVNGIEATGGQRIQFIIIESNAHDAWTPAYSDRDTLCWLLSQEKQTAAQDELQSDTEAQSAPEPTAVPDTDSAAETAPSEAENEVNIGAVAAIVSLALAAAVILIALRFKREQFFS